MKLRTAFFALVCLFLFGSCNNSIVQVLPDGKSEPTELPSSPESISVLFNSKNGTIDINWENTEDDVTYEVYRSTDNSNSVLLDSNLTENNYSDGGYPLGSAVSYQVRSLNLSSVNSEFTESSSLTINVADYAVKNSTASVLEYNDRIRVSWDHIVNEDVSPEYTIFRFRSKEVEDETPVKLENITIHDGPEGTKYIDDNTVFEKTPYYYNIQWQDLNTKNIGKESNLVFGIYVDSENENISEPNNDWEKLQYNVTFPAMTDLFIFKNGTEKDIDTFKIHVAPADIDVVNVTVTSSSEINGKLKYEFIYKGNVESGGTISSGFPNPFIKKLFGNSQTSEEPEDIIFIITPISEENIEITYDISYSGSW